MQDELLKVTSELQTVSVLYKYIYTVILNNAKQCINPSTLTRSFLLCVARWPAKALKTYNQYHTDCLIAEGKLKEAERLEERHTGKSSELGLGQSGGQRRSSVKKMERLMEKVSGRAPENVHARRR